MFLPRPSQQRISFGGLREAARYPVFHEVSSKTAEPLISGAVFLKEIGSMGIGLEIVVC